MNELGNQEKNPENISYFKTIANDYSMSNENKNLCLFKSINDILYFVYSNFEKDIIFYDLCDGKIIGKIKIPYGKDNKISSIKHFLDEIEKKDLLLTIGWYLGIKIWDVRNYECILSLEEYIASGACLLNDNGKNYLIAKSPEKKYESETVIKVYDLKGNRIKTIDIEHKDHDRAYFLEPYYDKEWKTNYIIIENHLDVKSYDFKKNKLYHVYEGLCCNKGNFIVDVIYGKVRLLYADDIFATIYVFDFHSGILKGSYKINEGKILSLCLWNINYLFVGYVSHELQLINCESMNIVKEFNQTYIFDIKKIKHPKYGECLIALHNSDVSLWK